MNRDNRLQVVLLAPGCDGTDVGESWSCFQWVKGLAEQCHVTLLTLRRHERSTASSQLPNVEVVEWNELPFVSRFERFNNMLKPSFSMFYRHARRWLQRELCGGRHFDLVHQLGPLALRYPCPATSLGIPMIIGPIAGSLETPEMFRPECRNAEWFTKLREIDRLRLRFDPWLRHSFKSADVVIGVAPYVHDLLQQLPIRRFELACETGIYDLPAPKPPSSIFSGALRLLHVGRTVRTKGLRDLIRALALLDDLPRISLDVVGAGNDLAECRREADLLGVSERITFHGQIPREKVEQHYINSDIFAFPSFREPSGNVVFEAMRHGLPVITIDQGGPGYVVDDNSGVKVSAFDPIQLAHDLAQAIRTIAISPDRLQKLSLGARQRVSELGLWHNKIDQMMRLYEDVVRGESND